MFDVYSMSLQFDILSAIIDCSYISMMNCVDFFHQWLIRMMNRHKLTMINHRDNEQWNVIVMNYRNFSVYVQRQIDSILRKYRHFAKTYVDDIIVFSNSLKKHLRHLNQIFVLFKRMNIIFKINKIFFDYSIISLLDQRVDSLKLTIATNKFETILVLVFFQIFKQLKIYLNKIEWLRQYVSYYIQKTLSL